MLIVQPIHILTINTDPGNGRDLVKTAEEALSYFPAETWDDIEYLGKLSRKHDAKIAIGEDSCGAFLFERLTKMFGRIQESYRSIDLLLGVTLDPIVAVYQYFDGKGFKQALYLVHDYVTETIGVISFFRVEETASSKVVAHGLGHSKGLRHHLEPVDLMHPELLRTSTLQVEGFCEACLSMLTKEHRDT